MPIQSISQKLHEDLKILIATTESGDRLPSEPELAKQLGVSRATLREAMRTFEVQGLLRRIQGSGTYVTRPSQVFDSGLEVLESIHSMADRIGLEVSMGPWRVKTRIPDNSERLILGMVPGKSIIDVTRVITSENRPVAFLIDLLPSNLLNSNELENDFTGSVLDLLIQRGWPQILYSRTEINAVTADSRVARAMGVQRGDALLCFTSQVNSTSGEVVDYTFSYFLPGYFNFHVIRRISEIQP